jgi:hypothetical protein
MERDNIEEIKKIVKEAMHEESMTSEYGYSGYKESVVNAIAEKMDEFIAEKVEEGKDAILKKYVEILNDELYGYDISEVDVDAIDGAVDNANKRIADEREHCRA